MLGVILGQTSDLRQAKKCFEKALAIDGTNAVYLNNFAEVLHRLGKIDQAVDLLRKAIRLKSDFHQAKYKLGTMLKKTGAFKDAAELFKEVIAAVPDFHKAYFQFGTLLIETGNFSSAREHLAIGLKLKPDDHRMLNNLAIAYQELDDVNQAKVYFQQSLQAMPGYEDAIRNLALLYEKQGEVAKAKNYFLQLAEIREADPLNRWKANVICSPVMNSVDEIKNYRQHVLAQIQSIKSEKIQIDVDKLTKLDIHPPSGLIYHGEDDLEIKSSYADLFKSIPQVKLPDKQNAKPRIGFVVTGGHEGVFIKCVAGILNEINTVKFEVYVVCSFPNGERILKPAIRNEAITFVQIPKSLESAVKLLASLNFDLLHYWEVGTDVYNYFIPYFKPTRIQCTSWGWPITSGIPTMDYFLTASGLDNKESQVHFSEKLVYFDHLPFYYYKPQIPALDKAREDFGLPVDGYIYLCTQNVRKIHPEFDQLVEKILSLDNNGQIVFLGDKEPNISELFRKRIKTVSRFSDRIYVLPRLDSHAYFNMLNLADVILDTTHYTGGANTNCDAFALGKPVVTLQGRFHRGRFTTAMYQRMDIKDLTASSREQYVEIATRVTNDMGFRQKISETIKMNSDRVFENKLAVSELENFFEQVIDAKD